MPTDTSAGSPSEGGTSQRDDSENLVFAAHDLGRDRPTPAPREADDAAFEQAPRPGDAAPAPPIRQPDQVPAPPRGHDGFVIRELVDAVTAPVDALVIGDTPPPAAPSPIVPRAGFRITSSPELPSAGRDEGPLPWTVRHPVPTQTAETPEKVGSITSRKGWTSRASGQVERSAQDAARRLREDAVHVSWKAAWIAVTTADNRLFRRREA
ncbi:MAG: hypothetical protein ACHQ06_05550 [Candidatus Dormibacteria bacterium]